jgi:hypothetical protein
MKNLAYFLTATVIFLNCTNPKSQNQPTIVEIPTPLTNVDSLNNAENVLAKESNELKSAENEATAVSSGTTKSTSVSTAETKPAKKKWSNKKKGVVIGATSGAVAGAVVSKKRGKGALVGGATGAAVGLGVGAILDKKENN